MSEALSALDETTRRQNLASDPSASAWVSANAGSGKTHVLTQRVIRLMLNGSRPSSILCLTYTKAAASEMSNRVFARLSRWTALSDEALSAEISAMEGRAPDRIKLADARRLFGRALETPGGLKIQTIHAFCEALLHQFPLEANVAGHFSVLDDKAAATLLAEARRGLLTATQSAANTDLARAFHDVLAVADETGLEGLLKEIVANRSAIQRFINGTEKIGVDVALRRAFGMVAGETTQTIAAGSWPLPGFDEERVQAYIALANGSGGTNPQERAYVLARARSESDPIGRFVLLRDAFLKKRDEQPYAESYMASKAIKLGDPDLCQAVISAQAYISQRWQRFKIARMFDVTRAALTLAEHLIENYESLKRERGFLDFEDFITRTEALLRKSDIGPWIHYKLDQGIDHLLLDEAQDTSPMQWEIIMSLTEDFFSGASARMVNRTIFTVGDEKQSIYSFQGARPERFADERRRAALRTRGMREPLRDISLQVSFRSTEDVLSAVDQVFSDPQNAAGLTADNEAVIHVSNRIGQVGTVDIWDIIADESGDDDDEDWLAPFDRLPEKSSAAQLARRMAASIRDMIGKTVIEEKGGPRLMRAGDVLVLVRKRDAFAGALARELKSSGREVPVAGTDRLVLSSHIAIQDLMALGRFALLPEDDLSLAELIKSPLVDMTEDDLDMVCGRRGDDQTAWERLTELAGQDSRWAEVHTRLARWSGMASTMRVHDFYAHLLGREGARRRFLARFGHEVSDVLDELLSFALTHEESGLPGLASFIATLENESPEIKREQDKGRDEVRIMTVHASKGLEAPVVFLVDGGGKPFDKSMLPKLRLLPQREGVPEVPCWVPGKDYRNTISMDDDQRLGLQQEAEYRRLLYVGMTRASDHLILCGYRKKRQNPGTWAELATTALGRDGRCVPAIFRAGGLEWQGLSWRHTHSTASTPQSEAAPATRPPVSLPDSLFEPVKLQPSLPRPLAPSGVHTVIDSEEGDRIVTSRLFAERADTTGAEMRGKLVHRLLQALPDFDPEERPLAADRYLARAVPHWTDEARTALADSVLTIVTDERFASLFTEESRAEVSVMGTISVGGRDFAVSGRVDRMGSDADRVFIVDYKTNRQPPLTREAIPFAHRAQLALYREVLAPIFPGKAVECLLIYTEGPHLFSLEESELEKALLAISAR